MIILACILITTYVIKSPNLISQAGAKQKVCFQLNLLTALSFVVLALKSDPSLLLPNTEIRSVVKEILKLCNKNVKLVVVL